MPAATTRVLVIRRRYLGDIVLLGSVLRNVRLHWPEAEITVLTETAYADVLALNPDVTSALTFPRHLAGWPGFVGKLRRAHFTHVLDFDNTDKTALVTRLTGAAVRVTFDRETNLFRHRRVYTNHAKITNAFYVSHHITDTYLALLPAADIPVVTREVHLVTREKDLEAIAPLVGAQIQAPPSGLRSPTSDLRTPKSAPKVLLHPGTRSPFRLWPVERFAAVCDRLQDDFDVQVFVVSGPSEIALVEQIRGFAKTHLVALEQRFTVGQFAALVAQFDLFLCHDSGPMHIAAAVGTPVVALFGSQNAAIWHPLGEQHAVLQTSLPCTCLSDAPTPCERGDSYRSYCVRKLDADLVFATVKTGLAGSV